MTTLRPVQRPYTSPLVKNPTYPVVMNHRIVEMSWEQMAPEASYQERLEKRIARIEEMLGIIPDS